VRKVHDYLTICAPAPFQTAGVTALGLPAEFYASLRAEYSHRRAILTSALDAAGLPYRSPEGAYYIMADFGDLDWPEQKYARADWTPDRAFAEYMARDVGVAVVPGSSFYAGSGAGGGQGRTRVRVNFAKREETLREAARRLQRLSA
jgi:aminotransferase